VKLSPRHLTALRSALAYYRVWVEWSQDKGEMSLAEPWRQGAYHRLLPRLVEGGLLRLEGPGIVGGGRSPVVTEAGLARLGIQSTYKDHFDQRPDATDRVERILTATADLREMLSMSRNAPLDALRGVVGASNVARLHEYIECIEINAEAIRREKGGI
jgi:hypothetical protein